MNIEEFYHAPDVGAHQLFPFHTVALQCGPRVEGFGCARVCSASDSTAPDNDCNDGLQLRGLLSVFFPFYSKEDLGATALGNVFSHCSTAFDS